MTTPASLPLTYVAPTSPSIRHLICNQFFRSTTQASYMSSQVDPLPLLSIPPTMVMTMVRARAFHRRALASRRLRRALCHLLSLQVPGTQITAVLHLVR
jgi:hypothetical protein